MTARTDSTVLRPLDPRVRVLWWTVGALAAVPPLAIVLLLAWTVPLPGPPWAVPAAAAAGLAVGVAAASPLRYARWRFAVTAEHLRIRRGVVWVRETVIPLRRLQFVDTRQGPLTRLLGLAEVVVHTAAPGVSGHLVGLDAGEAERLRERLASVGGEGGV